MARRRILDPEFWLDIDIAKLPYEYRLLYQGSWNFSDDYGVIEDQPEKLKAQVFPYDLIDVNPIRHKLIEIGKFVPFEIDGKKYLLIKNFLKYQRVDKPSATRNPAPPPELVPEYSQSSSGVLNSEEKRREVKISKVKRSEYTPIFEEFWKLYPKKVGKPKAFEFWELLPENEHKKIIEDVPKRGEDDKWINGYVKDPERYIKNRQWEDQIIKPRNKVEETRKVQKF